jgi:hypothetical protein
VADVNQGRWVESSVPIHDFVIGTVLLKLKYFCENKNCCKFSCGLYNYR